jgi:hypothetical protein
VVDSVCSRGHKSNRACSKKNKPCAKCEAEDREKERHRKRDEHLDQVRATKQQEYARQLAQIEIELEYEKQILKDIREEEERKNALEQRREDLTNLKGAKENLLKMRAQAQQSKENAEAVARGNATNNCGGTNRKSTSQQPQNVKSKDLSSSAREEWEFLKRTDLAKNPALDTLMDMIGLERIKDKFLDIKSRIDTAIRQNIDIKDERLSAAFLGNPGTG